MSQPSFNAAVLSTLAAFLIVPASAYASVLTSTQSFTVPTATAALLTGTGAKSKTTSVNTAFSKFNASNGVLTGVTIGATTRANGSNQNNSVTVKYDKSTSSGTTTSTVQSTIGLTAVGASNSANSTSSASVTCQNYSSYSFKSAQCGDGDWALTSTDKNTKKSSSGALASGVSTSVAAGSLNAYVGRGKINVNESLTVNSSNSGAIGQATVSTTATANWIGDVTLSYIYQDHAAAAFGGVADATLNLDFGSFYLGDQAGGLGFSLANLFGDRVALSLTGFTETGDLGNQFGTNLMKFDNLAAGNSKQFEADFLANSVGKYNATYLLTFADYAPQAASSTLHSGATLTLNLSGEVLEKQTVPNDVPEPASLMLLALGTVALGVSRKRRQR
jgi:hypothetical protein